MIRLVHITTLPQTAASFLHGQLSWMRKQGFEITVISSPGPQLAQFAQQEGIAWRPLAMRRAISPRADLAAIGHLARQLREISPHIVHAHTPKAGLVGIAAATWARVPLRIYQLHGLRFETAHGWRRRLLKSAEKLTCQFADRVICVSPSLRQKALDERLFPPNRAVVLANGSVNGLDIEQFLGGDDVRALGLRTRRQLGIPDAAPCVGFVGRMVRDKGVIELHAAWQRLRVAFPQLRLLMVGPFEMEDAVPPEIRRDLESDPRVHLPGLDWNTRRYYAAMDVFALPTHREGLGHVLLEAAAMGLPVVTCDVTGCRDAVVGGRTATLVPAKDPQRLAAAIAAYLENPRRRQEHGRAGRKWVRERFAPEPIWRALRQEYCRLLEASRPGVEEPSLSAKVRRPALRRGAWGAAWAKTVGERAT